MPEVIARLVWEGPARLRDFGVYTRMKEWPMPRIMEWHLNKLKLEGRPGYYIKLLPREGVLSELGTRVISMPY